MKRKIIKIDENACTGCGKCVSSCPEGALQIIDGKARVVSDLFCDGLGACIGSCPYGAITIEEREAEEYDEQKVMENIVRQGEKVIKAHLAHLRQHGRTKYLEVARRFLEDRGIKVEQGDYTCPSARVLQYSNSGESGEVEDEITGSCLRQWPIQLHLVPPTAPYFRCADVVIAADCTAFAFADFHRRFIRGNAIAIACPKLDRDLEIYEGKIKSLIEDAEVNTLTVVTMEVPCCWGLFRLAERILDESRRKVALRHVVITIKGEIQNES